MEEAGAKECAIQKAAVVVSELVANACRAASDSDISVRLVIHDAQLRVEVDDDATGLPEQREGDERGGFGLQLVDALTLEWGSTSYVGGKTVWAEIGLVG
jgi:two-component sensor histidine kinase